MNAGERRGPLPDEEWLWLRAHLRCRSVNSLFTQYSEVFGSPYSDITSFRAVLLRNDLFPITEYQACENVNRLIELYYQGPTHWEFRNESCYKSMTDDPHWLWRWHDKSIKTPTGVSFRDYPLKLKEKQFNEE